MGSTLTCTACGKTHRYTSEMKNIGTEWHPIWEFECPYCGNKMSFDWGKKDFWDQPVPPNPRDATQRAESSDIREYWIQMYFKENHKKLGFSHIEGPFDSGPDFTGLYRGWKAVIEVEREYVNYIQHRHHENPAFSKVNVLVVLTPSEPPAEMKDKLPKNLVYVDVMDFVEWFRPEAKKYADAKRIQRIIDLIAGEFHRRYQFQCQDKERDLSTCPDCDLCAYFGEGVCWEAQPLFHDMALNFIIRYKHPIMSYDFKLADIDPSDIDDFWNLALPE